MLQYESAASQPYRQDPDKNRADCKDKIDSLSFLLILTMRTKDLLGGFPDGFSAGCMHRDGCAAGQESGLEHIRFVLAGHIERFGVKPDRLSAVRADVRRGMFCQMRQDVLGKSAQLRKGTGMVSAAGAAVAQ